MATLVKQTIGIEGMSCASCSARIEKGLRGVPGVETADEWTEVEWALPLTVPGRTLGVMVARQVLPPAAKADEEQLLKIVLQNEPSNFQYQSSSQAH